MKWLLLSILLEDIIMKVDFKDIIDYRATKRGSFFNYPTYILTLRETKGSRISFSENWGNWSLQFIDRHH